MFKLFFWNIIGRFLNQIITILVSIVLTRILSPSEFGLIGIAISIIGFSSIFLDLGFKSAIIQNQEIDEEQLSAVFYLNLCVGFLLFGIGIFSANIVQNYYRIEHLGEVIKALSFLFLINAFALVPSSLLAKKLAFKSITFVNSFSAIVSGILAIVLAFYGFGIWSLIFQSIVMQIIQVIGYQYYIRWIPSKVKSFYNLKKMWNFGIFMFLSSVLDGLFSRLDVFIIGKIFPISQLGFYTRAQTLDSFVKQYSSGTLVSVIFPFLSKYQSDEALIKREYIYYLHIVSLVSIYLTGLLYLISKPLFIILFTEKWVISGDFFSIMALSGFVYPISALMVNILSVRGNSKDFFKLEVLKKIIILPVFLIGFWNGIEQFLYYMVVVFWLILPLNAYFVQREIGIKTWNQLKVITQYILIGFSICFIIMVLHSFLKIENQILLLFIHSTIFTSTYLSAHYILKTEGFMILFKKITSWLSARKTT